jgi:hypothetical protein
VQSHPPDVQIGVGLADVGAPEHLLRVVNRPAAPYRAPQGRVPNTRKLLLTAAAIMSVMLIGSSLVTTLLISAGRFCFCTSICSTIA